MWKKRVFCASIITGKICALNFLKNEISLRSLCTLSRLFLNRLLSFSLYFLWSLLFPFFCFFDFFSCTKERKKNTSTLREDILHCWQQTNILLMTRQASWANLPRDPLLIYVRAITLKNFKNARWKIMSRCDFAAIEERIIHGHIFLQMNHLFFVFVLIAEAATNFIK